MLFMPVANLGNFDSSPSYRVGASSCESTSWISDSTLMCKGHEGAKGALTSVITSLNLLSSMKHVHSYDVAEANNISPPELSVSDVTQIQITGSNFGSTDLSLHVSVGSTTCEARVWTSSSSISCRVRPGVGERLVLGVQDRTANEKALMSYTAPTVYHTSNIFASRLPSSGI